MLCKIKYKQKSKRQNRRQNHQFWTKIPGVWVFQYVNNNPINVFSILSDIWQIDWNEFIWIIPKNQHSILINHMKRF